MSEVKENSMSYRKILLIIWSPILVIALIYCGAFAAAKTAQHRYDTELNKHCSVSMFCYRPYSEGINQDNPFWLPFFKVDGQISSGKY